MLVLVSPTGVIPRVGAVGTAAVVLQPVRPVIGSPEDVGFSLRFLERELDAASGEVGG